MKPMFCCFCGHKHLKENGNGFYRCRKCDGEFQINENEMGKCNSCEGKVELPFDDYCEKCCREEYYSSYDSKTGGYVR